MLEMEAVLQELKKQGFLDNDRQVADALNSDTYRRTVIKFYQNWHGLPMTGDWQDINTLRSLTGIRYDSYPDVMPAAQSICKWPHKEIRWTIAPGHENSIPGIDFKSVMAYCWSRWEKVCGLKFIYVQPNEKPNVIHTVGRIDRSGNTLAWSGLPCGSSPNSSFDQKYDNQERWFDGSGGQEIPQFSIDLSAVGTHENGHAIGIDHLPNGSPNLMAPIYNPRIRTPQLGDINAAIKRYGPPLTPVDPDEPEPIPPESEIIVTLNKSTNKISIKAL